MTRLAPRLWLVVTLALLGSACENLYTEDAGVPLDGLVDVLPDVLPDAAPDGLPPGDARVDGAPDLALDAGPDATADAATDAAPDAGLDAGPDATVDAAVDADIDGALDADLDGALDAVLDAVVVPDVGPVPDVARVPDLDPIPDAAPPMLVIDDPLGGALTTASPIAVSGRVTLPVDTLTVAAQPVEPAADGRFALDVPLDEGPNIIRAEARRGASVIEDSVQITLDTTPPVLAITAPADGVDLAVDRVEVRGTIDDAGARVTVSGAPAAVADGVFSATVALVDGPNRLIVVATDRAGHRTEAVVTVTRDTEPPVVAFTAPADGSVVAAARAVLEGTLDDPRAVVTVADLEVPVVDGRFTVERPLVEGVNRIFAEARDPAGNLGQAEVTIVRDTTAPALSVDAPDDGARISAVEISVSGTVDDRAATVTVDGDVIPVSAAGAWRANRPLVEGENVIRVEATDALGNAADVELTVTRDTTAPIIAIDTPEDGAIIAQVEIDVAGPIDDRAAQVTVDGAPADIVDGRFTARRPVALGVNRYVAVARDAAGNTARAEVRIIGDREGPGLIVDGPVEGALIAAETVEVSGRVADREATITVAGEPVVVADGAFTVQTALAEGLNTLVIEARDQAGNIERVERAVTRDTTPPALVVDSPADGTVLDQRAVSITGTFEPGAALVVRAAGVEVDAEVADDRFTAEATLASGPSIIEVEATDPAGNVARVAIDVRVDDRPPTIQIITPVDGAITGAGIIQVTGRVEDPAVPVTVAGAPVAVAPDGTFTADVALGEGLTLIDAIAGGAADAVRVYRDVEAPRVSPIESGATAVDQVDIVGTVIDRHRAVGDGGPLRVTVGGAEAEVVGDMFIARDVRIQRGINPLTVVAEDGLGNRREAVVDVTRLDRAGPRIVRIAGETRIGQPGVPLPDPIVIAARDAAGDPLSGAAIVFEALDGGVLDAFPARGATVTVRTDAAGLARVSVTPGPRRGVQRVRVRAADAEVDMGEVFFATPVAAGVPARITALEPVRTVPVGATVRFVARVADAVGQPLAGVEVRFEGLDGADLDATIATDRHGRARIRLQAETAGALVLRATTPGVDTSAALVAHVIEQDPSAAARLVGRVLDDRDHPASGLTVRLAVPDGPVLSTRVDAAGRFAIEAPPGAVTLIFDPITADAPGLWPTVRRTVLARPAFDVDVGLVSLPEISGAPTLAGTTCADCLAVRVRDHATPTIAPHGGGLFSTVYVTGVDGPAALCLPSVDPAPVRDLVTWAADLEAFAPVGPMRRDGPRWCTDAGLGLSADGWHALVADPIDPSCPASCDDGDPCTAGSCADGRCVFTPVDGVACGDGCGDGICAAGACVIDGPAPDGTICDDGDPCTGPGACRTGRCVTGDAIDCDDADPCTDDRCDPDLGCAHAPRSEGARCAADGICGGTCQDGVCAAAECASDDPCRAAICDPTSDACQLIAVVDGTPCGDADACGAHTCRSGVCAPVGPDADGQACDDRDRCTADDRCAAGACAGAEAVVADDATPIVDLDRAIDAIADRMEVLVDRRPFLDVAFADPVRFDVRRTRIDCCPDGAPGARRSAATGYRITAPVDGALPGLGRTETLLHRIDGAGARVTVEVSVDAAVSLSLVGDVEADDDGCADRRCTMVDGALTASGTMTAAARITACEELDPQRPVCPSVDVEAGALRPVFTGACALALGDCDPLPERCRVRMGPLVAPIAIRSDAGQTTGAITLAAGDP